jgi:hypothetical protein
LFGGIALDGSVISIDRSANAAFYGKSDVTATQIFSGASPTAPEAAQRFLTSLARTTGTAMRSSPAPQADARANPTAMAPTAPVVEPARAYPLEQQSPSVEHPNNN